MARNPEFNPYRGNPSEIFDHGFIPNTPDLNYNEELVYEKLAAPYYSDKPQNIQICRDHLDLARDTYIRGEPEVDYQETLRLRSRDQKDDTERGRILEAFFGQQATQLGWFGENCRAVRTTEHDDRINATDLVLVFDTDGGEPLRLAVDITTAENPATLDKKLGRLVGDIDSGKLTDIKYFFDEVGGKNRQPTLTKLHGLPRVVIGLTPEGVTTLSRDLIPYLSTNGKNAAAEKVLRAHDAQLPLLKDIRQQSENAAFRAILRYTQLISEKDSNGAFISSCSLLDPESFGRVRSLLDLIHDGVLLEKTDEKLVKEFAKLLDGVPLLEELGKSLGIAYPLTEIVEKHSQIRDRISLILEKKEGPRVSRETRARAQMIGTSRPAWLKTDRLRAEPFRKWLDRLPASRQAA